MSGRKAEASGITNHSSDSQSDCAHLSGRSAGLLDGLSRFFTPTAKRRSHISFLSRRFLEAENWGVFGSSQSQAAVTHIAATTSRLHKKQSHQAANRILKKSKLLQASRFTSKQQDRVNPKHSKKGGPPIDNKICPMNPVSRSLSAKHKEKSSGKTGRPAGSSAVRCLFDGLSHFFSAEGERKRNLPIWTPMRRYRKMQVVCPDSKNEDTLNNNVASPSAIPKSFGKARSVSPEKTMLRGRSCSPALGPDRSASLTRKLGKSHSPTTRVRSNSPTLHYKSPNRRIGSESPNRGIGRGKSKAQTVPVVRGQSPLPEKQKIWGKFPMFCRGRPPSVFAQGSSSFDMGHVDGVKTGKLMGQGRGKGAALTMSTLAKELLSNRRGQATQMIAPPLRGSRSVSPQGKKSVVYCMVLTIYSMPPALYLALSGFEISLFFTILSNILNWRVRK